jgi:short-subunit dehydrogenase
MRRGNGRTLITGASAGIGLELSREFARHGHPVILMARNEPRLKEIATQLNQAHHVKVTEHLKNLAPLQRLGEPADIASVVSFLADQWPSSAR